MQPDRLAVQLRPRGGWEAIDLGFQMAREWWRPIWLVWIALYLPAAGACFVAFDNKLHAMLLLWWLKPLFDRAVLHTASRAVFGDIPTLGNTLRDWRQWLGLGLIRDLTLYRFSAARSFSMPVTQLEKQTGRAGRRRRNALGSRMRSYAVWLTLVCMHLEAIAFYALHALSGMLKPAGAEPAPDAAQFNSPDFWFEQLGKWEWTDGIYYVCAVTLLEPFYVVAGFALYLNRRAVLEAWDIELALHRLEERLRARARAIASLAIIAAVAVIMSGNPGTAHAIAVEEQAPPPAQTGACPAPQDQDSATADADDSQPSEPTAAGRAADAVFASPEFSTSKEMARWRYIGKKPKEEKPDSSYLLFLENLSRLLGAIGEKLIWVVVAGALVVALYYLRRFAPRWMENADPAYEPPSALFGLDVTPESLPDDVAATAAALAGQGKLREALSLLYRGALSALVHRHQVALVAGDTEDDCVRAASRKLPASSADYFGSLVRAWQDIAWASRHIEGTRVVTLCDEWQAHFAQRRNLSAEQQG